MRWRCRYLHSTRTPRRNKRISSRLSSSTIKRRTRKRKREWREVNAVRNSEQNRLLSENTALVLELKRLSSAHQSELEELKDAKQLKNRVEELTSLLRESENSKLHITNSFDQMQYEFEHQQK